MEYWNPESLNYSLASIVCCLIHSLGQCAVLSKLDRRVRLYAFTGGKASFSFLPKLLWVKMFYHIRNPKTHGFQYTVPQQQWCWTQETHLFLVTSTQQSGRHQWSKRTHFLYPTPHPYLARWLRHVTLVSCDLTLLLSTGLWALYISHGASFLAEGHNEVLCIASQKFRNQSHGHQSTQNRFPQHYLYTS